jgi:hypothetical protein
MSFSAIGANRRQTMRQNMVGPSDGSLLGSLLVNRGSVYAHIRTYAHLLARCFERAVGGRGVLLEASSDFLQRAKDFVFHLL